MSRTRGARIGSDDIVEQIGAGGMGEVYRATDARLDGDVAIKVLPATVAAIRSAWEVRAGGQGARRTEPSKHRPGLRHRGDGRGDRAGDGARRGRDTRSPS